MGNSTASQVTDGQVYLYVQNPGIEYLVGDTLEQLKTHKVGPDTSLSLYKIGDNGKQWSAKVISAYSCPRACPTILAKIESGDGKLESTEKYILELTDESTLEVIPYKSLSDFEIDPYSAVPIENRLSTWN
eukprot:TRINITY_DN1627_c0_g1_i1.p1 TRINITY_DN1627_c0_g1~~TRINITY_DN1627_c0_g1_i1.p1  ORF type:complete len:131 (-),score=28.46 TRINITY_DN1627_c0_g1_i1:89-481(-)